MFCIVATHLASRPSTPEFCASSIMDFIESRVETDLLFTMCCRISFISFSDDAFGSVEASSVEQEAIVISRKEPDQAPIHYLKPFFNAIFLYLGLKSTTINYQDGFKGNPA
jgi:hypothetical protein